MKQSKKNSQPLFSLKEIEALMSDSIKEELLNSPHNKELNDNGLVISHGDFNTLFKNSLNRDSKYIESGEDFQGFADELAKYRDEDDDELNDEEDIKNEDVIEWIRPEVLKKAEKIGEPSSSNDRKIRYLRDVQYKKPSLKIDNYELFKDLIEEMPNFTEVISHYKGSFLVNSSRDVHHYQAPNPVLLLGDPGIGKTHFAKTLAAALQTNYHFMDANSITSSLVLTGSNGTWQDADCGKIFRTMSESKTVSPLIIFDEIDKLTPDSKHSTFSVFHQLLEKNNAKDFYDEFLGVHFNASNIIYVLTANDEHSIAPTLLDRMKICRIEKPGPEHTMKIAQKIYHNVLNGSELFAPQLEQSELEKLAYMTAREITRVITDNIYAAASDMDDIQGKKFLPLTLKLTPATKKRQVGF